MQISVMLAVENAAQATAWYKEALGAKELTMSKFVISIEAKNKPRVFQIPFAWSAGRLIQVKCCVKIFSRTMVLLDPVWLKRSAFHGSQSMNCSMSGAESVRRWRYGWLSYSGIRRNSGLMRSEPLICGMLLRRCRMM